MRQHWFLSKAGVSMMQAHGWGERWTCRPSGAVRSCQRTGSRPTARRGQAIQLSPLWHWLRPSIWLREAHHGWRGTRQILDYMHIEAEMHTREQTCFMYTNTHEQIFMHAQWHTCTPLCLHNDACQGYFRQSPAQSAGLSTWITPPQTELGNRSDMLPSSWTDTNKQL